MRKYLVLCLLFLSSFALAGKIPVGKMVYFGDTPDGSANFDVYWNPPAGITLNDLLVLLPTMTVNGYAVTFPMPVDQYGNVVAHFFNVTSPTGVPYVPGTLYFPACPCALVQLMLYANPGTTVAYLGHTVTLKRVSVSSLQPLKGQTSLVVKQEVPIYLYFPDNTP